MARSRLGSAAVAAIAVLATLWIAPQAAAGAPPTRWCGAPSTTADLPDAVSNVYEIHVVYAYPTGATDRLAQFALPIAADISAIDSWWQGQDSTRTLRFDLASFPGCDTAFGQLDISDVQLPHDSGFYASEADRYDRVRTDLGQTFKDANKKYLVYYDGPVNDRSYCGVSVTGTPGGGPTAYAEVFLASLCGDGIGSGGNAAIAAVHEVIHNLNALVLTSLGGGPPHRCPRDGGHPCDNPSDILYPATSGGRTLSQEVLDYGRDDYYNHHGTWFDVRNSLFLVHLDETPRSPQVPARSLTATSNASLVKVVWGNATGDAAGPTLYRVYRDGALLSQTYQLSLSDSLAAGTTASYAVQPQDALGNLGPTQAIRFTVGLGLVDSSGRLVRDTVPPSAVTGLRAEQTGARVLLTWQAADDSGGIRGYAVTRNGKGFGALVKGTALRVTASSSAGSWAVRAVDTSGNTGLSSVVVKIAAPRKVAA